VSTELDCLRVSIA